MVAVREIQFPEKHRPLGRMGCVRNVSKAVLLSKDKGSVEAKRSQGLVLKL